MTLISGNGSLKILMQMRPNAFTQRGGDTVVMERVAEGLRSLGVTVDIDLEEVRNYAQYDLVHLFNFCTPEVIQKLAQKCVEVRKPYIVTTMYEDWPTYFSQMMAFYQALNRYVLAGQPSGSWLELEQLARQVPRAPIQDNSWSALYAEALIASGEYEALTLQDHYPFTRRVRIYHCGSEIIEGVDDGQLFVRETGIKDFVLCVGRLETRKNQLMLLKAMEDSEIPLVFLTGGFSYQAEYDRTCRQFRRKGETHFLGRLEPQVLASAFAAARVHVLPSWCELPGIVTIEAARYGTNVVVTEYGTIRDYLGDLAYYCEPDSAESIYQTVLEAFSAPRKKELKERASHFTWFETAKGGLEIYKEILDQGVHLLWASPSMIESSRTGGEVSETIGQHASYLLVCSSGDDARILLPVARKLKERGHQISLLSLDAYYHESASEELEKSGLPWKELPGSFCKGRYLDPGLEQSLFTLEAAQEIEFLFQNERPDCVFVSGEQEMLEALVLRIAERHGSDVVRIMHGIERIHPINPTERRQAVSPGDSGWDVHCVWGELAARQNSERGMGRRVVMSGNPYLDSLVDWQRPTVPSGPYTVLVAGENLLKEGSMLPLQEFAVYEQIIRRLLEREDVRVVFHLHPEQARRPEYLKWADGFGGRVRLAAEEDLLDTLKSADLLISVSGRASAESALMGIPTAVLDYYLCPNRDQAYTVQEQFLELLKGPNFPQGIAFGITSLESHAKMHSRPVDGKASERVSRLGEEVVAKSRFWKNHVPQAVGASVIIDLKAEDSLDGLSSVLRPDDFGYEVIAIDRSLDGTVRGRIEERFDDRRLRVAQAPGSSSREAFAQGAQLAQGKVLFRLHASCIAYPGWVAENYEKFLKSSQVEILLSYSARRDEQGMITEIVTPPMPFSSEAFRKDEYAHLFAYGYAFRRHHLGKLQLLLSAREQFDREFIQSIVDSCPDPGSAVVIGPPCVASPFHPQAYGRALFSSPRVSSISGNGAQRVSVVLYDVSRGDQIDGMVSALSAQSLNRDAFEVICVGAEDESVNSRLRAGLQGLAVTHLDRAGCTGTAAARQMAVSHSKGDVLIFLNDEAIPTQTFLEEHLGVHRMLSEKPICCIGPVDFAGPHSTVLISLALKEIDYLSAQCGLEDNQGYGFDFCYSDNVSIPRDAFEGLGLSFDEQLSSLWGQNIDLAYQLWREGYRYYYNPRAGLSREWALGIEKIERAEAEKGQDIIRLMQIHPELIQFLLSLVRMETTTVEAWTNQLEADAAGVSQLLGQIQEVQDMVPSFETERVAEQTRTLIQEVGNAVRLMSEHYRLREMARIIAAGGV